MTLNPYEEEKKHQIAKSLIDAMRNHPPLKKDMYIVLNQLKEAFPELIALKEPMSKLPEVISKEWFNLIPTYDIYTRVEKKLKKKPFRPQAAMDAFAYLMWLATNLLFRDELRSLAEK